jgi:hypothetical protein
MLDLRAGAKFQNLATPNKGLFNMVESKLLQAATACKTHGPILIGPYLHLRLCDEMLGLAHRHDKLTRELQSVEDRFAALQALVQGARR